MRRLLGLAALSLFGVASLCHAKEDHLLTLNDAVAMAMTRDLDAVLAQERLQQAIAKRGQAIGVVTPQASIDTYQRRQTRDLGSQGIPLASSTHSVVGPFDSFDVRVRISQLIFDRSALDRLRTVDALKRLSEEELRKVRQDVAALAASLYLDAARSQEREEVALMVRDRERRALRIAHTAIREGRLDRQRLIGARSAWLKSHADWLDRRSQTSEAMRDLKIALTIPLDEPVRLDSERSLSEHRVPSAKEISSLLVHHPAAETARAALLEKEREKDIFLSEYWPKLSVFGDYGLTGDDPPDSQDTYTIGIQGSWNVWDGLQRAHKVEEAESARRAAQATLETTVRRLDARSRSTLDVLAQASAYLEAADMSYLAATEKQESDRIRYESGASSEQEWTESRVETALVKDTRQEAVAAYLLSKVGFFHSIGRIEDLFKKDATA